MNRESLPSHDRITGYQKNERTILFLNNFKKFSAYEKMVHRPSWG